MNARDLLRLGVPLGEPSRRAADFISRFVLASGDKARLQQEVMAAQRDLVTVLGEFMPKLVKMAPAGERPED